MEAKALVESYLGAEADGDTVAYLLQLVELLDLEDESAYEECAAVFFEYKSDLCQGAETEADTTADSSSSSASSSSKALVAKLHDILHTKGKTQSASSKKVAGSSSPSSASLATTTGAKAKGIVSASPASEADIIADMKQQMAKIHSFMKEQEATSQRGAREGEENSPQEDGKMQTEGAALEGGAKKEAIAQSVSVLEEICDNFQKQKLLEQEQQREEEEEEAEDDESKTKQRQAGAVESIERDTLESVLQEVCGGDLSAAALWVTENDVLTYQALLRKKRVDAEERERDSKKNNEKIFKQYGLRPVSNSDQNSNLARAAIAQKKSLRKAGGGPQSQHPQKRYHNNQVVVSKGEKYFTVKEGEEWDGGSRGKVISKGKRGKGFT